MASFQAAGTSYATHGLPMIPFYIFYSMFGFQRTGDQMWAFGDARGRGFLMGATAGRTTLTGEGLQHDDGHSHVLATTVPSMRAYDPAFAYELAAIVRDGIERMYGSPRTSSTTSRSTTRTTRSRTPRRRHRRGDPPRHLPLRRGPRVWRDAHPARLVGSAPILRQVLAAGGLRPALRRGRRGLQRAVARSSAATRSTPSAGTDSTRRQARGGTRTSARSCPTRVARSWPPPTR